MSLKHIEEWRTKSTQELLDIQTDKMLEMVQNLEEGLGAFLDRDFEKVKASAIRVTGLEKTCDRVKEALEEKLFVEKKSFQFTAPDRHATILRIEDIVNHGDIIAQKLLIYDLKVPPSLIPGIKDLVKNSCDAVKELRNTVTLLRKDFKNAMESAIIVEDKRREARNLCWRLLKEAYLIPTDHLTMLLTRELILDVTRFADIAETFSDYITTLSLKYSKI